MQNTDKLWCHNKSLCPRLLSQSGGHLYKGASVSAVHSLKQRVKTSMEGSVTRFPSNGKYGQLFLLQTCQLHSSYITFKKCDQREKGDWFNGVLKMTLRTQHCGVSVRNFINKIPVILKKQCSNNNDDYKKYDNARLQPNDNSSELWLVNYSHICAQ